jgi:putative endonuclease
MFVVYVIKSLSHNFTYVGFTANLEKRLHQHNHKLGRATKPYAPFELLYSEPFNDRISARKREKYLKSTAGKNYLKKVLTENPNNL